MPGLGENILSLAGLRRSRAEAMANLAEPLRLKLVAPQGTNPGELRMLTYVPPGLPPGAPMVVVLHGCTQNAAAYDHGAGWTILAERHGFVVLFPEQTRSNNGNLCFNWFQPEDTSLGRGEVESIRQMVQQMLAAHHVDPSRVYITGLSAGGAMTAAMLATAPTLFAGGAIIAGLPYGSATSVQEALAQMQQAPPRPAAAWGDKVRRATPYTGPWPAIQIWHGDADHMVVPGNADALVAQWTDVLALPARPSTSTLEDGAHHDTWMGADGRPALERWSLPGFGHGTPVATTGDADQAVGVPGPHMLENTVGATWRLARGWGLLTQAAQPLPQAYRPVRGPADLRPAAVIDKALRATGLLR